MAPPKRVAEGNSPAKQVNNILRNLRGEHFRHARNIQGKKLVSSGSLASLSHNQPTLPISLIFPSPAPATSPSRVPGPSPPRSWRSPTTLTTHSSPLPIDVDIANTAAWRERALSLLFSTGASPSSSLQGAHYRLIYPEPSPTPRLTLLCLQLIRSTCPGADLAKVVPYIPLHLRRVLLRFTAIHAPLSQIELDALRDGATHVDTELIVVGPRNTLQGSSLRENDSITDTHPNGSEGDVSGPRESWDAVQTQDSECLALSSLVVLSSPLSTVTILAFPPTITHLALINISHPVSLQRLPMICPLLVFLDLSYNAWLSTSQIVKGGTTALEEVAWGKWRGLKVVGLRECLVTPKVLLELNRGRWEDVRVVQ